VDVVAGGLATNCIDEKYAELVEQMAPIVEQVKDRYGEPERGGVNESR
jgi:hypothetical protein